MIPFVSPLAQYQAHRAEIRAAIDRVLDSGWYILGESVSQFEQAFANWTGMPHAVGVGNGTDALVLALLAAGVGPGDEVITVSHTAVATVSAVVSTGATPVLVDVCPQRYTLNPGLLDAAYSPRTKAVIAVHLYGQAADLVAIQAFTQKHGLLLIEDCAQAHGARWQGKRVGSVGDLSCFSFYPTKNLGAIGDGGLVACRDPQRFERLQLLRQYGWKQRYISDIHGLNTRLDELQAAILLAKLPWLDADNAARRLRAQRYRERLQGLPLQLPPDVEGCEPVYHLFVIQLDERDALQGALKEAGIQSLVHYPVPVHQQPAYHAIQRLPQALPVTERLAQRVLSLPMFPELPLEQVDEVADAIHRFFAA